MPDQTPNTSPVIDAFRRGIKKKKDNVNILENGRACKALGSLYPKVVIQKLLITAGSRSCFLAKKNKISKSEQERNEKCLDVTKAPLSCGNSWEQKTDCMDLEDTSSDSDKWVSSSEADTQKACARNNGTVNNASLCRNPGLPTELCCSPTDSELRLPLEALCREGKRNKHRVKQSKPHPVKPFSGTSLSRQVCLKGMLKVEISDSLCVQFFVVVGFFFLFQCRMRFLVLPFSDVMKFMLFCYSFVNLRSCLGKPILNYFRVNEKSSFKSRGNILG